MRWGRGSPPSGASARIASPSLSLWMVSVSVPARSSHSTVQASRSRPEARENAAIRSASRVLPQACRAK